MEIATTKKFCRCRISIEKQIKQLNFKHRMIEFSNHIWKKFNFDFVFSLHHHHHHFHYHFDWSFFCLVGNFVLCLQKNSNFICQKFIIEKKDFKSNKKKRLGQKSERYIESEESFEKSSKKCEILQKIQI